jgi:hypothetical protein
MLNVPVIMLLAAAAILVGVVYVAMGRGGELGTDTPTWTPTSGGFMNMAGVQVQLPPTTMIGYDVQATLDELQWLAQALSDRNAQVAALQTEVARLQGEPAEQPPGWSVHPGENGPPSADLGLHAGPAGYQPVSQPSSAAPHIGPEEAE